MMTHFSMSTTPALSFKHALGKLALALVFAVGLPLTVSAAEFDQFKAEPGKALVVFTRVSTFGGAINSSIFDVTEEPRKILGIIKSRRYVTYQVDPGERMFMVIGENADFMRARLEADTVYFANVQVRTGAWKARFSLRPWSAEDRESSKFLKGFAKSKPPKDRDIEAWATNNAASIQRKHDKFLERWNAKLEDEKERETLQ